MEPISFEPQLVVTDTLAYKHEIYRELDKIDNETKRLVERLNFLTFKKREWEYKLNQLIMGMHTTESKHETITPHSIKATTQPTKQPSEQSTANPTEYPTHRPTQQPTTQPTKFPTKLPTKKPTTKPTLKPTTNPTEYPTHHPTKQPTKLPTKKPTKRPTAKPTLKPTAPTTNPTEYPIKHPTNKPSNEPTMQPSKRPTTKPDDALLADAIHSNQQTVNMQNEIVLYESDDASIRSSLGHHLVTKTPNDLVLVSTLHDAKVCATADRMYVKVRGTEFQRVGEFHDRLFYVSNTAQDFQCCFKIEVSQNGTEKAVYSHSQAKEWVVKLVFCLFQTSRHNGSVSFSMVYKHLHHKFPNKTAAQHHLLKFMMTSYQTLTDPNKVMNKPIEIMKDNLIRILDKSVATVQAFYHTSVMPMVVEMYEFVLTTVVNLQVESMMQFFSNSSWSVQRGDEHGTAWKEEIRSGGQEMLKEVRCFVQLLTSWDVGKNRTFGLRTVHGMDFLHRHLDAWNDFKSQVDTAKLIYRLKHWAALKDHNIYIVRAPLTGQQWDTMTDLLDDSDTNGVRKGRLNAIDRYSVSLLTAREKRQAKLKRRQAGNMTMTQQLSNKYKKK
eukprot:1066054_1